jgi:hypothetical protein
MSRTIASSILRKLSACASSRFLNWIWSSLLTPSTSLGDDLAEDRRDLGLGGRRVLDDVVQDRRDQVSASRRRSARMSATATGCVM